MNNVDMNSKMERAVLELEQAAEQFRKVCRDSGDNRPIVFMQNNITGLGVFVSDHRYTGIIKRSFLEYD